MDKKPKDASGDFEQALTGMGNETYLLRLYVTGMTPRSIEALANIRQICEKHLKNRYELEVVDTFQKPHQLKEDQIVAMPTLLKKLPAPLRRIVGDLSNTERVLIALDLIKKV